jgi:hypothetical protein
MTEASVTTDSRNAPDETAAFFDEVKNGRDETTPVSGGYGSYPKIRVVELGDAVFYGFTTSLDESRGPWLAGYRDGDAPALDTPVWFERDTVFNAETLEPVDGPIEAAVNALIAADEGNLVTDGGEPASDESESSDSDEMGELFG